MRHSKTGALTLAITLLLAACGDSGEMTVRAGSGLAATPAAFTPPPPTPAVGAKCDARYGNAPRPLTTSGNGLLANSQLCQRLLGEELLWKDANGDSRAACLVSPSGTSKTSTRPLLVWLHPSLFPMDIILYTDIPPRIGTADLNGDPTRPGFSLLLVAGRDTQHYYPAPDDVGLGWDNWYRNLDRTSPALNVDVAAIDHFIGVVKGRGVVDEKRVFLSGWSNGSAMAQLYGLNTPGIAAAAVYSAPNPFDDSTDPCPQPAFGHNKLAMLHVGNQCDVIGICDSSEALLKELSGKGLAAPVEGIRVSDALLEAKGCDAACAAPANPADITQANQKGTLNHVRWPLGFTDRMLAFLKAHPLP